MSTGTTVAIGVGIVGLGAAAFLLWRGSAQQQMALSQTQAANAGAVPASGGGAAGLANRLWSNWKSDPLGIKQTEATVKGAVGVVGSAVSSIGSGVSDVFHSIGSIF